MKLNKIKCPNCNNVRIKGTLFECDENVNGTFRVKCKKCNTFIILEVKNGVLVDYQTEIKEKN